MAYRESQTRHIFPTGLKLNHIADEELLSVVAKEKAILADIEQLRTELRNVGRDRDEAMRTVDSSRESFNRGNDEFQSLVDRKQSLRSRMDELQLEQSKMSDSRNELQLIGFEIKPMENEISELVNKIEEITRNEAALSAQRTDLLKECGGFESVTDVDEHIAKLDAQLESAKKGGNSLSLNSISKQKANAERAKKNVMASYQLDERIVKEGKRVVMLKKTLDSKEGQLKTLTSERVALREKLDSQKSIDDDFKKIKSEIADINKKLDIIQAKKKEKAAAAAEADTPANTAKAAIASLQVKQREMFARRDSLNAEIALLAKLVEEKFCREVSYNPQYRRHLIGRNGATLDTLMQDFSVALNLDGAGRESGIATIYGPRDLAEACASAIKKIVEDAEASDCTEEMPFNAALTKLVIGARGATIDNLQTTSGCQITVSGDIIRLNGTQESIDAAKALLSELFAGNAQEELHFDPSAFEMIIGRGGSVIRQIEKDTGVKSIRADRDRGVLSISGHQDNVAKAVSVYRDIIQQSSNKVSIVIPIKMVALVIGPQGKTIKDIQESTKAVINIQNRTNDAVVTIRGGLDSVSSARKRVEDIALRDEVKIPFDISMASFLTTRPVEKGPSGEDVERLSPLEAIRSQCECDYVGVLRAEGKVVIRGRPEAASQARSLLLKFLQSNAPKSLRLPIPAVIMSHLVRRQEGGSILDKFRSFHSANISNVDFDRNTKMATIVGQPNASIVAVNAAAHDLDALVRNFRYVTVPVPPLRCGAVIGGGGKVVAEIQSTTNTIVNVDRDAGEVTIFSPMGNDADVEHAASMVCTIRDTRA